MIHELYERAAVFHGHKCPGLAIGVRAAAEAKRILEIEDIQDKELYCVAENSACYIDGIQALLGCTFGKGNLICRYTGKTAFTFYHGSAGKSLRLVMRELDFSGDRDAMTEYILTAPLSKVFDLGKPRFELPPRQKRGQSIKCALCGEPTEEHMMRVKNGQIVCADCAEQAAGHI